MSQVPPVAAAPRARAPWVALGLGLGAAAVVLFFFNPAQFGFYPRCLLHATTGWDCPGCGGLRAAHQLLHGNVAAAFRLNPLAVALLPLGLGYALWRWVRRDRRPFWQPFAHPVVLWTSVAVVLVFGIVRNLR